MTTRTAQTSVSPELSVRRGREALEFYKAAFGAVEIYRMGEGKRGRRRPALGGQRILLGFRRVSAEQELQPRIIGRSTVRLLLIAEDPHSVVEQAVALGASKVSPVAEEHGWLLGRIEDPFGRQWEIGKPLVDWPPSHAPQGAS